MSTEINILLCEILFLALVFVCRKSFRIKDKRNFPIALNIYLLTIGLVISPMVNAVVIVLLLLSAVSYNRKINQKIFCIITITIAYVAINTMVIYSSKGYDPDFNPYIGMIELWTYCIYIVSVILMSYSDDEKKVIIEVSSLFSICVFIFGLLELATGLRGLPRITSIFRNPNLVGIYGLIIFSLVFKEFDTLLSRHIKYFVLASALGLTILSQSRVSWLGLAVYLVLLIISSDWSHKFKYMLGLIIAATGAYILFADQISILFETRVLTALNREDFSTFDRMQLLYAAIDIFKEHPLFGTGLRSFTVEARNCGYFFWSGHVFHPHNAYLELFQTLGLVGFIIYSTTIIYLFRSSEHKESKYVLTFGAFLVIGLLNRLLNEYLTTIFFWTTLTFMYKGKQNYREIH